MQSVVDEQYTVCDFTWCNSCITWNHIYLTRRCVRMKNSRTSRVVKWNNYKKLKQNSNIEKRKICKKLNLLLWGSSKKVKVSGHMYSKWLLFSLCQQWHLCQTQGQGWTIEFYNISYLLRGDWLLWHFPP